jgi:hypothetical protein
LRPSTGSARRDELEVEEGGFLFKPRGLVHALWNPTDTEAIVMEFISPAGFEAFFEEMGILDEMPGRRSFARSRTGTDRRFTRN